jgi:hypothetical protein
LLVQQPWQLQPWQLQPWQVQLLHRRWQWQCTLVLQLQNHQLLALPAVELSVALLA